MPDPFTLAGSPYPIVSCQPITQPLAVRLRFDGSVGSDLTVAGDHDGDRPWGWDVVVGDLLAEDEADALIELLETPGYVTAGGAEIGAPWECAVSGEVIRIPGALQDMASVAFRLLARRPGEPVEPEP